MKIKLCLLICLFGGNVYCDLGKLREVYSWNQVTFRALPVDVPVLGNSDFAFPGRGKPQTLPEDGSRFIQYNNVPMGVDRWGDKLFITFPRRRHGIPATLTYLSLSLDGDKSSGMSNPPLRPYPDYETNTISNDTSSNAVRLVSVYRTRVDACDRLWMVDTGLLEIPGESRQVQPPAIVVFDLKSSRIIHRFELSEDINPPDAPLASITIDLINNRCDEAFAYIPDLTTFAMIVYSMKENRAWRVRHNSFYLDPLGGDYEIAGLRFQWNDGVFSGALTPPQRDGFRYLIYHAMSSTTEFAVSTRVLMNETLATRSYHGNDFMRLGDKGPRTQTAMHAMDPVNGILFLSLVGRNAVSCWNTQKPFTLENHALLAQDDNSLIYPSDIKVDFENNLWVIANSMPIFIYSELDTSIPNFHIYRANVNDIVRGTACDNPTTFGGAGSSYSYRG